MDISETIVVYDLKPATDDRSDKKSPGVCMPPVPELYTLLNHEKDFFETCNKWVKYKSTQ